MMEEWPGCAVSGCGKPAFFKVEVEGDAGAFLAWLCPFCMTEIPSCVETLNQTSNEESARLEKAPSALIEGSVDG